MTHERTQTGKIGLNIAQLAGKTDVIERFQERWTRFSARKRGETRFESIFISQLI